MLKDFTKIKNIEAADGPNLVLLIYSY